MTASWPSPPKSDSFSLSYPLAVVPSPALLFDLAGCHREGPLVLVFVQPVGELLGPSDLSLALWLRKPCTSCTFEDVAYV